MPTAKAWWMSKTIVSDILTMIVALYSYIQANIAPNLPAPPDGIVAIILVILGGFGIFGRVTANTTIQGGPMLKNNKGVAVIAGIALIALGGMVTLMTLLLTHHATLPVIK